MKVQILQQMCSTNSIVRVIFATFAIGMGVDVPNIRQVIHVCPPCSVKQYFQETGRAGRDGKPADAILYYNNRDIATNRSIMQSDMREFCHATNDCLRKKLLKALDYDYNIVKNLYTYVALYVRRHASVQSVLNKYFKILKNCEQKFCTQRFSSTCVLFC